jgi:hypothetical protein
MKVDQPDPEDLAFRQLWDRRHRVLSVLNVTGRYHRKRQRLFDLLDKATTTITVVLGGVVFSKQAQDSTSQIGMAIASVGLLALVFGYNDKKQLHKELADETYKLIAKIELIQNLALTDEIASKWEAEYNLLNAKEPPALRTLVEICEYEQAEAGGQSHQIPRPSWFRRFFADFF